MAQTLAAHTDLVHTLTSYYLCSLSLVRWCHLVLLGQLISNTALRDISVLASDILGCLSSTSLPGASLWPDGTCWNSISHPLWWRWIDRGAGNLETGREGMMWDFQSGIKELLVALLHLNDLKPLEVSKESQCLVYVCSEAESFSNSKSFKTHWGGKNAWLWGLRCTWEMANIFLTC